MEFHILYAIGLYISGAITGPLAYRKIKDMISKIR